MPDRRELILANVEDLVSQLLYEGRREDEKLPRGASEAAIAAGEITAQEIAGKFRDTLSDELGPAGVTLADVVRRMRGA